VSLHPGAVNTELGRYILESGFWKIVLTLIKPLLYYFFKTPEQGAQTNLYCALEDHNKLVGGAYYSDCAEKAPSSAALNKIDAQKLWDISEKLISESINKNK